MNSYQRLKPNTAAGLRILLGGTLLASLAPVTGWAQFEEEEDDEVFEMSPFVVTAAEDSDYRAQSTLAGTRLKTDVKDVSASLSIIPQVFMEDIGATDAQDVLAYSVNTENEDEFIPDDTEGLLAADTTTTRVRGLTVAANSRNFFNTNILADTYNTERLTISRGANSILFGIGSASGTLDATYKMAMLGANKFAVNTRTDDNGSTRYVGDVNLHLGEKFAFRLIGMDQTKKTFMDPEFDDETRYYGTITFRPFQKTTIRAYYENIENYRVRGRRIMPGDGLTEWIAAGKPFFNNQTGLWVDPVTEVPLAEQPDFAESVRGSRYLFSNGNTIDPSETIPYGGDAQYWENSSVGIDADGRSLLDESIIPFDRNVYGEANWANIEAEVLSFTVEQQILADLNVEFAYNAEDWTNISREALRPGMTGTSVQADVNMFLWEERRGRRFVSDVRNPNLGRYFVESQMIGFDRMKELETFRGTLSYQLDLTERSGWFGKHLFSGLWQKETWNDVHIKVRAKNIVGGPVALRSTTAYEGGGGDGIDLVNRAYLDLEGDLSDGTGVTSAGPWTPPAESGRYTEEEWPISYGSNHENPLLREDITESMMAVWQARFGVLDDEDDELILTFGLRQDTYSSRQAFVPKVRDENGIYPWEGYPLPSEPTFEEDGNTSSLGVVYHTPVKGLSLLYNRSDNFTPQGGFLNYWSNPHSAKTGETNDYGISFEAFESTFFVKVVYFETEALNEVEHDWFYWEPNWSVIYPMEDNIRLYAHKQADPPVDDGEREGIFHQRMARDPNYVPNSYNPDPTDDLAPNAIGYYGWHWRVGDMRPVRDRKTDGFELELFFQPKKNWNIRLTAAQTESVDSNIAPHMQRFILDRLPVWEHYLHLTQAELIISQLNATSEEAMAQEGYVYDPQAEAIAMGAYDDAMLYASEIEGREYDRIYENRYSIAWGLNFNSSGVFIDEGAMPRVEELRALEGLPTTRSRKYRVNLTTNYDFKEGRLANLGLGGGMRYRSKTSIGSLGKLSTEEESLFVPPDYLIADVTKPVYGDDILQFDFWASYFNTFTVGDHEFKWTVSVNVYNAFSSGGLKPAEVDFEGNTKRMLIEDPRIISFNAGLQF